jgi:hypothetical protein
MRWNVRSRILGVVVDAVEAGVVIARLRAQWPVVAADDVGARDWLRAVMLNSVETAEMACEQLLATWVKDRGPRPADWYELCRGISKRRALEQPIAALVEGRDGPEARARVSDLIEQMRNTLRGGAS